MKNDPRTRYTQMIIKKAFGELLQQKPVNKITVREICERAEINRSTFYKHYSDCCDLLDKLKEEALTQLDGLMADLEGTGTMPVLMTILETMKNNANTFNLIYPKEYGVEFARKAVQRCYQYLDPYLTASSKREWDEGQKEWNRAFLVGGISGVIEQWMRHGCKETPERIAAAIMDLSEIVMAGLAEK